MKLITDEQFQQLLKNGETPDRDHKPVVKIFAANTECVWLLSEIDPADTDMAFGLCDLGIGFPELGYVYLPEIEALGQEARLIVKQDTHFIGKYPLSTYHAAAQVHCRIVTDDKYFGGIEPAPSTIKPGV